MSDPLDPLHDFDPGVPMSPLPPAEVRRRGDRRRRRNTALTVVAAAIAVAVVATPIAVLADGGGHDPAPTGQSDWRHQIPADFPLTDGLPTTNDDGTPVEMTDQPGISKVELCGQSVELAPDLASTRATDVAGATYGGAVKVPAERTLVLLPDAGGAKHLFDDLRRTMTGCKNEQDPQESTHTHYVTVPATLGDEAIVVDATSQPLTGPRAENPPQTVLQVVRTGNAVYVASYRGAGDLPTIGNTGSAGVVEAMSVFAGPTASKTPSPTVTTTEQLIESNLLTSDEVPARSRLTAWKVQQPDDAPTLICQPGVHGALRPMSSLSRIFGASIDPTPGVTQGGGGIASRVRLSVLQFDDTRAAASAYATVVPWIEDCDDPSTIDRSRMSPDGDVQRAVVGGSPSEYRAWSYPADDVCAGCDAARFDRMGVAQVGNRLVLVSLAEVGGPQEPSGLDSSMSALIAAAIDKAGPVGAPPPVTTSPPSSSDDSIPSDFPIDQGLQAGTGDGGEKQGPSSTVGPVSFPNGFCGVDVWPAAGSRDRLAVSVSGPESLITRELVTFASREDAAQVIDDMRNAAQRCRGTSDTQQDPVNYQVIPDTTGENSVSFGYTYYEGPGGVVYQFVQLGSAVLAQSGSDDINGASLRPGVKQMTAQLTPLYPAVCELTGDC